MHRDFNALHLTRLVDSVTKKLIRQSAWRRAVTADRTERDSSRSRDEAINLYSHRSLTSYVSGGPIVEGENRRRNATGLDDAEMGESSEEMRGRGSVFAR